MRSIELTDDELLLLDGKVTITAQKIIDEIKEIRSFEDIGNNLYAEIVKLAKDRGKLTYTHRELSNCATCNKRTTYPIFKSGRRKGEQNINKPRNFFGISFMDGFVLMRGYSSKGFCSECGEKALKTITNYIRDNNLQIELQTNTNYVKEHEKKCLNKNCSQLIWEFDMKLERTIMGDGYYYSQCPICNTKGGLFNNHELTHNFRMVKIEELEKHGNCWQRQMEKLQC